MPVTLFANISKSLNFAIDFLEYFMTPVRVEEGSKVKILKKKEKTLKKKAKFFHFSSSRIFLFS